MTVKGKQWFLVLGALAAAGVAWSWYQNGYPPWNPPSPLEPYRGLWSPADGARLPAVAVRRGGRSPVTIRLAHDGQQDAVYAASDVTATAHGLRFTVAETAGQRRYWLVMHPGGRTAALYRQDLKEAPGTMPFSYGGGAYGGGAHGGGALVPRDDDQAEGRVAVATLARQPE